MNFNQNSSGFVAGTFVHTNNGLVPIEQIKIGDLLLSKPEIGEGEHVYKRVLNTFKSAEKIQIENLKHRTDAPSRFYVGGREMDTIYLSNNHPVWVNRLGEYAAEALFEDDITIDPNLKLGWQSVSSINHMEGLLIDGTKADLNLRQGVFSTDIESVFWVKDWGSGYPQLILDFRANKQLIYFIADRFDGQSSDYYLETGLNVIYGDPNLHSLVDYFLDKATNGDLGHDFCSDAKTHVYNLEVEDYHSYFVGELGIWVHDSNAAPISQQPLPYLI